jgi:hypothetical protein
MKVFGINQQVHDQSDLLIHIEDHESMLESPI